ncbi:hypothetical protein [Allostreptomyces psammosilenae]|uniref:Uncharacterized protein n=1 Tax=Allostreptomyces psammosilenae TaxID=1892865 RepID=A0A853A340_9ACTN|nr:hypothetical protein [Allostreptomyces psammosilenae]NYI04932.1 hypothetical protein [Allostreptomyces psammosilenae]
MNSSFLLDLLERVGWTAAQAGVGVVAAETAGLETWWAVPIATLLAAVKGQIATRIGAPGTAATLPSGRDPSGS